MNHVVLLLFIIVCYIIDKIDNLPINIYIVLVSIMLFLLGVVMICGYIRVLV